MIVVAYIHTDFPDKFGIPRQSGLVPETKAKITFTPEFNSPDAVRGIEGFDYLWLLWQFQNPKDTSNSLTVRPPRLGGNTRAGVFATRSPFRPNGIGLSCVKLDRVEISDGSPILHVSGADLRDMTPIYDIKPYLPFTDSHPNAAFGFSQENLSYKLDVQISEEIKAAIPAGKLAAVIKILEQDPRPSYQNDPNRVYGFFYAGMNIKFVVYGNTLKVLSMQKLP